MALSSNTVIHFTKSINNLVGILKENFRIKYCRELVFSKTSNSDLLIPMVSFCDIPFSQIVKHLDSYGYYGIGLKKDWAEKMGLNPVLYVDKNSSLADNIIQHTKSNVATGKTKLTQLTDSEKRGLDFLRYIKNYQGDLVRIGKRSIPNYRFSDEREWRYVLGATSQFQMYVSLTGADETRILKSKNHYNILSENERLIFKPQDINYIIIKNENERDKIISTLEKVNSKYPHEQVKRLTSRIISTEQLNLTSNITATNNI